MTARLICIVHSTAAAAEHAHSIRDWVNIMKSFSLALMVLIVQWDSSSCNAAAEKTSILKIFPGTMWCGAGNLAESENILGIFQGPDHCCRAHDLCPFKIHPFKSRFGIFNARPHTAMHCSCDESFKNCLNTIDGSEKSRIVGGFYFNHLNAPCFVLKKGSKCMEKTWWGKCLKRVSSAITGQWQHSVLYE